MFGFVIVVSEAFSASCLQTQYAVYWLLQFTISESTDEAEQAVFRGKKTLICISSKHRFPRTRLAVKISLNRPSLCSAVVLETDPESVLSCHVTRPRLIAYSNGWSENSKRGWYSIRCRGEPGTSWSLVIGRERQLWTNQRQTSVQPRASPEPRINESSRARAREGRKEFAG